MNNYILGLLHGAGLVAGWWFSVWLNNPGAWFLVFCVTVISFILWVVKLVDGNEDKYGQ